MTVDARSDNADLVIGGNGATKLLASGTTGTYVVPVTNLTSGTVYAFKAYATNSGGTGYSGVATFVTDTHVSFATTGGAVLRITQRDAAGNVVATFDGDFAFERLLLAGSYVLEIHRQPGEGAAQSYALTLDASTVVATLLGVGVGPAPARATGKSLQLTSKVSGAGAAPEVGGGRLGKRPSLGGL